MILSEYEQIKNYAAATVPQLLILPDFERYAAVSADDANFTAEVAWNVLDHACRTRNTSPHDAVPLFRLAAFIADGVVERRRFGNYQGCRAAAWKELAFTCRCIGEHGQAADALIQAEDAVRKCPPTEQEALTPRIKLQWGILYTNMRKYDAAEVLIREAYDDFVRLNDRDRADMAIEQQANVHIMKKDGRAAVDSLRKLVLDAGDDATKARRYQNFADALELAEEHETAAIYVRAAMDLHCRLGATYDMHKGHWELGRILDKLMRPDKAIAELSTAAAFMRSADPHGAILVDLDMSAVEIRHGLADKSTFARLRANATYAISRQMPEQACRALLYLQRLGEAAVSSDVAFVREFIADLEKHPHREFVAPRAA